MSLSVHQIAVGGFDNNFSYLITDAVTRNTFVVDPTGNFEVVISEIERLNLHIVGIILTHTHFDHYDQLDQAVANYHAPIYVYSNKGPDFSDYDDVRHLEDDGELALGTGVIKVIYTPGHEDNAVCLYISAENAEDKIPKVITGDTLFVGGCGRTTETRVKDLYESLAELTNLPNETVVYPGHDYGETPTSTIGHEKTHNKYYLVGSFNEFKTLRLS